MMEIHLHIIGVLLIILALLHFYFPRYFNWKQELGALTLINRQIMYVHMYFIALGVMLIGLLCITSASDLMHTAFGKKISLGIGICWFVRLIVQFVGYSSQNWKGKPFETIIHILLATFWTYMSSVFFIAYLA